MAGMAHITLIGNLGRDPEMSYTPDGVAVTKFSIAVTHHIKDQDKTTWYNCVAWRKAAETLNMYLKKGQQVYVQGELEPREYTTRDGQLRTSLDVTVEKFQFIGGKAPPGGSSTPSSSDDVLGELDEHPF